MSTALATQSLIDDLLELVAALDRRVPQLDRDGERAIARDASTLRLAALTRIAELARLPGTPDVAAAALPETPGISSD